MKLFTQLKHLPFILSGAFLCSAAHALTFNLPHDGSTVLGEIQHSKTITGDTLVTLARRYQLGYMEIIEANPEVKRDQTFGPAEEVILPTQFILPETAHRGIVINVSELRLYFYTPGTREVKTFPIGIGRQGWGTPLGLTYVASKERDPTWVVPKSIMEDRSKDGVEFPSSVAPGPDNPLGGYRLRLAIPTGSFLIHGSNDPSGIGRRSSSGCIRMQPEAIESFYDQVAVGTPVTVVDQPVKAGWLDNDLYIEAHIPLQDGPEKNQVMEDSLQEAIKKVTLHRPANIDWTLAEQVIKEQHGYPIKIGSGKGPIPAVSVPLNPSISKVKVSHAKKLAKKHKGVSG